MAKKKEIKKNKESPSNKKVIRDFTPMEVYELNEMQKLINSYKFISKQVETNTALVPRGQELVKEYEAIATVMENTKNLYVSNKLIECGYESGTKCDINLSTGEITLNKN